MAGRPAGRAKKRAASVSTVATINHHAIQYLAEARVLKPVDPSIHSDSWPILFLRDATVYREDGTMANLLHVELDGPLMVRGRLELQEGQEGLLRKGHSKSKTIWIEIPNTATYSLGLDVDDMPILWSMGKSGWYEIEPSPQYAAMGKTMFEGITLQYNILQQYEDEQERLRGPKKKRVSLQDVQLSIEDVLLKYALAVGDGATFEEIIQRCKKHAPFLLAQFPRGTGFSNWLSGECPGLLDRIDEAVTRKARAAAAQSELGTKPATADVLLSPTDSVTNDSSGKPSVKSSAKSSSDEARDPTGTFKLKNPSSAHGHAGTTRLDTDARDVNPGLDNVSGTPTATKVDPAKSDLATRLKADGSGLGEIEMRDFADDGTNTGVVPVSTPGMPQQPEQFAGSTAPPNDEGLPLVLNILNEYREELLAENLKDPKKKHPSTVALSTWIGRVYMKTTIRDYYSKTEIVQYYAPDLARELGPEWQETQIYKWAHEHANKKVKLELVTEDMVLGLRRRQKPATAGKKTPADRGSRDTLGIRERQGMRERQGIKERQSMKAWGKPATPQGKQLPGIKPAGLRPSGLGLKRNRDLYGDGDDADLDDDAPPKKMARTSGPSADGTDMEQAHNGLSSDDDGALTDGHGNPLQKIVVVTQPLPSSEPSGPNQTWVCDKPECHYVVRVADGEDGQAQIIRHFNEHEKLDSEVAHERQANIDLAQTESQGYRPINYLVEKIRKAAARAPAVLNGEQVPQAIKRSLAI